MKAGNGWELETRDIVKAQKTYECRRLETEDPRLRLGLCRGVRTDVSGSPMLPFFPTSKSLSYSGVFHLPKNVFASSFKKQQQKKKNLGLGQSQGLEVGGGAVFTQRQKLCPSLPSLLNDKGACLSFKREAKSYSLKAVGE